jgi:quinol monooxygenase YgiN
VYARSTTFQAEPASIDAGVAYMRDTVLPALEELGAAGMSLMVDRRLGRCIATSAWESEAVMHLTAHAARPLGERAAQLLNGTRKEINEWEVTALHRDHRSPEGACLRVAWFSVEPHQADLLTDFYRTLVLPAVEQLEGFCSASLLLDKPAGRAVSSVTFDNAAALDQNREQASALRTEKLSQLGGSLVDICEFELAIAHLRVPELV